MLRKWLTMLLIVTTAISSGANLIERGNALGRIFIPAHPELPVIFAVQELQKHFESHDECRYTLGMACSE